MQNNKYESYNNTLYDDTHELQSIANKGACHPTATAGATIPVGTMPCSKSLCNSMKYTGARSSTELNYLQLLDLKIGGQ